MRPRRIAGLQIARGYASGLHPASPVGGAFAGALRSCRIAKNPRAPSRRQANSRRVLRLRHTCARRKRMAGQVENRQIVEDEQRQWRCPPPSRQFWIAAEASSGRGTSVHCPGHPSPHKNLRPSLSQTGTSPAPRTLATEIPRIFEQKWALHVLTNLACFVSEPNNLSKHDAA